MNKYMYPRFEITLLNNLVLNMYVIYMHTHCMYEYFPFKFKCAFLFFIYFRVCFVGTYSQLL